MCSLRLLHFEASHVVLLTVLHDYDSLVLNVLAVLVGSCVVHAVDASSWVLAYIVNVAETCCCAAISQCEQNRYS